MGNSTGSTGSNGTGTTGGQSGSNNGLGDSINNDPPLDLDRLFNWQAAVTKTESDYQQAMTNSRMQFEDRIKSINEDAATSAEARNKTTADLHAQSSADLSAIIQQIKTSAEAAKDRRRNNCRM
jgi:hypothetical protein